jgi:hypothetical protein
MVLSIIALVIQLLPSILSSTGVISPALSTLIGQLSAAIPGIITSVATKQPVTSEIQTILAGIQTELGVLRNSDLLNDAAMAEAQTLDAALTDALAAFTASGLKDDPSNMTPLPTDL